MKNLTSSCVMSVIFHHISSIGHHFFYCRKRLWVKISYRGMELQHQPIPSLFSGLSEQFADSAANKPQSRSTIKELKWKYLDDSTHLCTAGSAVGWGCAANAYLRRERAKFRISPSSTSLLFLSPYKLTWMCSLWGFFVGVKIRFFFSPQ